MYAAQWYECNTKIFVCKPKKQKFPHENDQLLYNAKQLSCIYLILYFIISAIDCGVLSNPVNGSVEIPLTTFNAIITYTCNDGYTLKGDTTRTCESDEQWSGSAPVCLLSK